MTTADLVFDPFSQEFFDGAWDTYRRMRDDAPVYYNAELDFYALTRHVDVAPAYKDSATYSSARGTELAAVRNGNPGSTWQDAFIESFNGRLRDELLNSWRFDSLLEARMIIEDGRRDYNASRPHSAHGELTQAEFALQWATTHQPKVA